MFGLLDKLFGKQEIKQGTPEGDILEVLAQSREMILLEEFPSMFFEKKRYMPEPKTIKKMLDEGTIYLVDPGWNAHHRLTLGEKAPKWAKEILAPPKQGANVINLR